MFSLVALSCFFTQVQASSLAAGELVSDRPLVIAIDQDFYPSFRYFQLEQPQPLLPSLTEVERRRLAMNAPLLAQPQDDKIQLTQAEIIWLREHPDIRLGVDGQWAPLAFFSEHGEYQGMVSDYLAHLAGVLGVVLKPQKERTWDEALAAAKLGEIDVLATVGSSQGLGEYFSFSEPYLQLPIVIFARDDAHYVNSLDDLVAKRVIVEAAGHVSELLQEKHPELQLVEAANTAQALRLLSKNEADVYVGNLMVASHLIAQEGLTNLNVAGPTQYTQDLRLAVRKDWPELFAMLARAIDSMSVEQKAAIQQRWIAIRYDMGVDYDLLWQVIAGGLFIMFLGTLWLLQVRRQREALRRSEERFQLAMAASSDGLWDWNIATGEVYYSPGYMAMLGYGADELAANAVTWQNLLHPDDKKRALVAVERALRECALRYEHEFRLRAKNGAYLTILCKGGIVALDSHGKPLRAVGTQTDISERKQAEEALRKLSLAVEQSPSMVMITDCEGVIEYVNPKFTRVTGYSASDAIGQTPSILESGLMSTELYDDLWQTIRAGKEWRGEMQNKKKNGEIYWERETISPLTGDDGVVHHYVALKEDVTARKQAEEALLIFQRFAETSGQGFGIATLDGDITYVNQTLSSLLAAPAKLICQSNFIQYFPPTIQARMEEEILPALRTDGQWIGELPLLAASGRQIPTLENFFVIRDEQGKARYFGNVITDITRQKKTEQALHDAKDEAEQASRFKSEFLANMSHEIRTPLNAIMGMTYLVKNTQLTVRQRDYIDKVQSSSRNLLGVINDILDFSKIEAGRLDMEDIDFQLDDVFENLANIESQGAAQKGIEIVYVFDPQVPHQLKGDPLRLGQVLINLTSNAVKFTEQGQIVISVTLEDQTPSYVRLRFEVQDSGIGIEHDQAKRLFNPFTQADGSTTRKYGGTGLGLAISKQLVTMMGGKIWVESVLGQGSSFCFTAQFGCVHEGGEAGYAIQPDLRGTRVLVVDDNAMARASLCEMLASFSFEVTTVSSGADALAELARVNRFANEDHYDLVLMDWKMPGMDGVEASRLIYQSERLSQLPTIIMVTAYGREEAASAAAEVGIDRFLSKPVSPSTLFDAVIDSLAPLASEPRGIDKSLPEVMSLLGAKVLVAEDNRINQQVAQEILESMGVAVSLADNGVKAVQAVREQVYDLVLMDIQMPEMDGYQATKAIRNDPQLAQIPIVAMTAHAMAGDREKCLAAGMDDHLAKPIDPSLLYRTLKHWIVAPERAEKKANVTPSPPITEQPSEMLLPDRLPGIDLEQALVRIGGNKKLLRRLLLEFVEDHRHADVALAAALSDRDTALARRLVHTIRGVAGSLGAVDLAAVAGELEQTLTQGLVPNVLHGRFVSEFQHVVNGLLAAFATSTKDVRVASISGDVDEAQSQVWLTELASMLEGGDAESKSRFELCRRYLLLHTKAQALQQLEAQIDGYDFDDALLTLNQIKSNLPRD